MVDFILFLETRTGDKISYPNIKETIQIAPGFLFVATGNDETERGQARLPNFVLSQFRRLEVANPSEKHMETIIQQIVDSDYPKVKTFVRPNSIQQFIDQLQATSRVVWSLRSVRRFLRRAADFVRICVKGVCCSAKV
jgi:MoxR-like ATPase